MANEDNKLKISFKIDGKNKEFECEYSVNTDKEATKYIFKIEGEMWKACEFKAYLNTKGKYNVVGFRKGKAPKHIIENNYGKNVFLEDTIDVAINECYRPLYDEVLSKLPLAVRPEVELIKVDDNFAEFSYNIVLIPEVKLNRYKGLDIEKVNPEEITEKAIDKEVSAARERVGCWNEVTDRGLIANDTANIDFSGSVDGVKFEGGTAEKQDLVIGSNSFIPGFEDQLVGMSIGEQRDIKVTFPADYGAENLAGKDAVFAVKLNSIKCKTLPELDDEFAKDVSEFDTLSEYKDSIKTKLASEAEQKAKYATESKIIDALLIENPIELPEKFVESLVDQKIDEFKDMLKQQHIEFEKYLEYVGEKEENIRAHYKDDAVKKEKIRMLLAEIIKAENLNLTPEDIDAEISKGAEKLGKTVEEYKQEMKSGEYDYIANSLMSDKIMDYLILNNNVK